LNGLLATAPKPDEFSETDEDAAIVRMAGVDICREIAPRRGAFFR